MDNVSLVKGKLNIVDVIGEYVTLKKAGTSYKGLCPFHNEKTSSFNVSAERQMYHCFGCSSGGDVIAFIQNIESVDFPKALEILALKAGVTLEQNPGFIKKNKSSDGYEALKMAQSFYHSVLVNTTQGKEALSYLASRGVLPHTIDEWGLGYSPDGWDSLIKALTKKGVDEKLLMTTGLIVRSQAGKQFDRFRTRIMFPIIDITNRVIGFSARILPSKDDGKSGKYINSPQGDYYNKSEALFGIHKAKKSIREKNFVVLVEGNLDVIMSAQAGVTNVIAASGTALTEQQLKIISRLTPNIYFCFDQDEAGKAAALRGIELAMKLGMSVHAIVPPVIDGKILKDPADIVAIQPQAWVDAVSKAVPIMEFVISDITHKVNVATGEGKKQASQMFRHYASMLMDHVEKSHWFSVASRRFDIPEEVLRAGVVFSRQQNGKNVVTVSSSTSRHETVALHVLALLVKFPVLISEEVVRQIPSFIHTPQLAQLAQKLFLYYNKDLQLNLSQFIETLRDSSDLYNQLSEIAILSDKEFSDYNLEGASAELQKLVSELKTQFHTLLLKQLSSALQEAEAKGEHTQIATLMEKITHHQKLLSLLS